MTWVTPIGVTMGDASGIGPEIVAKTMMSRKERAIVFGSHRVMADIVARLDLALDVRQISSPEEARFAPASMEVIDATQIDDPPLWASSARFRGRRHLMPYAPPSLRRVPTGFPAL